MIPDKKRVGRRIKDSRNRAGLTQEQLGEMIDFSKNHISGIERGLNLPTVSFLLALYSKLNVSPDEILLGAKKPETDEITRKIQKLSSKGQRIVLNIIDILLNEDL